MIITALALTARTKAPAAFFNPKTPLDEQWEFLVMIFQM
jgi:hypothetical protein